MPHLSIGEVARQSQTSIDTIRYYERAGLLAPPARRASGYRNYDEGVIDRLRFIRRAKALGFTLAEIAELLALSAQADGDMEPMKSAAQAKLALVEDRIRELQRIRSGLQALVEACPGHGALSRCPIASALSGDDA